MKLIFKIILIALLVLSQSCFAEYFYILNDRCIEDLFSSAKVYFINTEIEPIKDSRGIILRYYFEKADEEYYNYNINTYWLIEDFLAKIENPVIIEVHVNNSSLKEFENLKKWEVSTIIANQIESIIIQPRGKIKKERLDSIGYGEFLPAKNTPNNGGKTLNRVDIIILCNINGE